MNRKRFYKLEIIYVKYSPMVIAFALLVSSLLSYIDIHIQKYIGHIFGASLLVIGHMYNSSRVHNFCKYHRMFIHYILVNILVNSYDSYIGIPISDKSLFLLHLIIAGIFLFLILYYHQKCEDYDTNESD